MSEAMVLGIFKIIDLGITTIQQSRVLDRKDEEELGRIKDELMVHNRKVADRVKSKAQAIIDASE